MQAADMLLALLQSSDFRIALLVGIICLCLASQKTLPASGRHLVWLCVILASLILPVLATVLPTLPLPLLDATTTQRATVGISSPAVQAGEPASVLWLRIALVVYAVGVAVTLAALLHAHFSLRRLLSSARVISTGPLYRRFDASRRQLGLRRRVRLLSCDGIDAPLTYGWIKPRIVMPEDATHWSAPDIDSALTHELAHVLRRDWPATLLAKIVCAAHWYNPALWLAARRLSLEAEKSCDDVVLRAGCRASDYAEQLIALSSGQCAAPGAAVGLGESELATRILAILDPDRRRSLPMPMQKPLIIATVLASACVVAACQVTAATPAPAAVAATRAPAAHTEAVVAPAVPAADVAPAVVPDVVVAPLAVSAPLPAPAPVAAPAPAPTPRRPAAAVDARAEKMERLERLERERALEEQRRVLGSEIDQQRIELQRMEQELTREREELEQQFEESRKQLTRAREAIEEERRHLHKERQMIEAERLRREREVERLRQEHDDA